MTSKTERRRYHSPKREAEAAATRERIVAAFASQLNTPGVTELNLPLAAKEAAVSLRTLHNHFPDSRSRVAALAAWADATFGPVEAPLETADDLPPFVIAAYARAERHWALTRALWGSALGNEVRLARLSRRRATIHRLLAELGAPEAETARASAVVGLLASSEAGIPLVVMHGLSIAEAGQATSDAVRAIVAQLREAARATAHD